jgi:hypothetical protein
MQAGKPTYTQPQSVDLHVVNHGNGLLIVFGIERNRRLVRQPKRGRAALRGRPARPTASHSGSGARPRSASVAYPAGPAARNASP